MFFYVIPRSDAFRQILYFGNNYLLLFLFSALRGAGVVRFVICLLKSLPSRFFLNDVWCRGILASRTHMAIARWADSKNGPNGQEKLEIGCLTK